MSATSMPAAPAPKPPTALSARDREIPGAVPGLPEGSALEERLGPIGITLGAIAACTLVWVLAVLLKLF